MIDITAATLTSSGFQIIIGANERLQVWVGVGGEGESVTYAFDSAKNKAISIEDASPTTVALFAVAVVVIDVIGTLPIGASAKAAAIKQITDALERI
jgi:hypothetical protein